MSSDLTSTARKIATATRVRPTSALPSPSYLLSPAAQDTTSAAMARIAPSTAAAFSPKTTTKSLSLVSRR
jgi:hypothetical protein